MFLDIFHDFSQASSGSERLRSSSDLYKSSPNLNVMTTSYPNSIGSSLSTHSDLSSRCDSDMTTSVELPPSPQSHSDSRSDLMSQSLYVPPPAESMTSADYSGSQMFQEKVDDLRTRLATILESKYSRIISPPDTTTSYIRTLKLRKPKTRSGGRVFNVFSRTGRRQSSGAYGAIVSTPLGK